MPIQHNQKCLQQQAETKAAHDAYVTQWPNYCRFCDGTGVNCWWETPGDPCHGRVQMCDPCEACYDKCPRCAAPLPSDDAAHLVCTRCGWQENTPGCPLAEMDGPCDCEIADCEERRMYFEQLESQMEFDALQETAESESWGCR